MSWGAVAIGAGTAAGAYLGYKGQQEAAKAQKKGAKKSIAEQRRQFNLLREDYAPYREAGERALTQMEAMTDPSQDYDLEGTEAYQFRREQGQRALNNTLAATGNRFSGRAAKEAMRFGQGLASQEFGQQYNRLAGLAGTGQTATGQTGQAGMQMAGNVGQAYQQMGQAQAQASLGQAGAMNQAIQGGIGNYLTYQQNQQMLNRLNGQGGYNQMYGNTYGQPITSGGAG